MSVNFRSGFTFALLAGAVGLGGCTSLLQGKQYEFPAANEPSATVRLADGYGTSMDAITFNEKGCYAGYTTLPSRDSFIQAPVAVGKELVLTYKQQGVGTQCQVPFSFTPEQGATYTVKTGTWSEAKTGFMSVFNFSQNYCGIALVKKMGDQESVQPIQPLRIKTAFACLTFVKKDE